jgi:hypothetical protein
MHAVARLVGFHKIHAVIRAEVYQSRDAFDDILKGVAAHAASSASAMRSALINRAVD